MNPTKQETNKALVLEAFDTLFNKRDYAAAERYWSPNYIQHSAHIAPGREGLFDLIKSMPSAFKYEPGMIVEEPIGETRSNQTLATQPLPWDIASAQFH